MMMIIRPSQREDENAQNQQHPWTPDERSVKAASADRIQGHTFSDSSNTQLPPPINLFIRMHLFNYSLISILKVRNGNLTLFLH